MMLRRLAALVLLAVLRAAPAAALSDVICTGDCTDDGTTTIDELVQGVTITLGSAAIDTCRGFDLSGDAMVTVDELIGGVRNGRATRTANRFESSPPATVSSASPRARSRATPSSRSYRSSPSVPRAARRRC